VLHRVFALRTGAAAYAGEGGFEAQSAGGGGAVSNVVVVLSVLASGQMKVRYGIVSLTEVADAKAQVGIFGSERNVWFLDIGWMFFHPAKT